MKNLHCRLAAAEAQGPRLRQLSSVLIRFETIQSRNSETVIHGAAAGQRRKICTARKVCLGWAQLPEFSCRWAFGGKGGPLSPVTPWEHALSPQKEAYNPG